MRISCDVSAVGRSLRVATLFASLLLSPSLTLAADDAAPPADAAGIEYFEKSVRPILVARCYECHDASKGEVKGSLAVDSREALLAGGDTGAAIVPGDAKKSLLIDAVNYGEIYQMPPKSKLPAEEIAILTKWVDMGAPFPVSAGPATAKPKAFDLEKRRAEHWCWQPIAKPAIPAVKNATWPQQPLDHFILAKLEASGMNPAAPATKQQLVRRLYFDLIGLPPTPAEVQKYLDDNSSSATEELVSDLLSRQEFGEHWARRWMDLARYAESRGHEFDYDIPNAFEYRDYIIRAFNDDLPYDQFLIEHLAGDLLETPRLGGEQKYNESVIATGFWHLGEWVHSPVDIRKDETDRYDNAVDVFSKSFLAITVSCARCHDHKFDAISQADYSAMLGFLQSSSYRLARFDTEREHLKIAKELAAIDAKYQPLFTRASVEGIEVQSDELARYLTAARKLIPAAKQPAEEKSKLLAAAAEESKLDVARLSAWAELLATARDDRAHPLHLIAHVNAGSGKLEPGVLERVNEEHLAAQDRLAKTRQIISYEEQNADDWYADGVTFGLGIQSAGMWRYLPSAPQQVELVARSGALRDFTWDKIRIAPGSMGENGRLAALERSGRTLKTPTFTVENGQLHYLVSGGVMVYAAVDSHSVIHGPLHGQIVLDHGDEKSPLRWITQDLSAYQGHRIHLEFVPKGASDTRIYRVVEGAHPGDATTNQVSALLVPENSDTLDLEAAKRIASLLNADAIAKLAADESSADRAKLVGVLLDRKLWSGDAARSPLANVAAEYLAEREKVTSQIKWESRLAMALLDGSGEDEPLLIRGNVRTVGELVPRNLPQALQPAPLAATRGSGRLEIARQLVSPENPLVSRVIANRLFHYMMGRGVVASVDNFGVLGEQPSHPDLLDHLAQQMIESGWSMKKMIRQIALSSTYQMASVPADATYSERDPSNLLWHRALQKRLPGEAIRDSMLRISGRLQTQIGGPSVPVHLTPFMQGRGRPGSGPLDGNGRRSVYISIRRNFLSPMMITFDTPIPFTSIGRRNVSNVPAQSLIMLNDPLVTQLASTWAQKVSEAEKESVEGRIALLYREAFAREPSEAELKIARNFLVTQAGEYKVDEKNLLAEPRLWNDLAHALWNVKEFIFID